MNAFKRVLLLGTGPVAVQLAVIIKRHLTCEIGIAGRKSVRSDAFFDALTDQHQRLDVTTQNSKNDHLSGDCAVDEVFTSYEAVKGEWDTLILTVTTDAYLDVLKQLDKTVLKGVKCVVLISPTFGSNRLVDAYMSAFDDTIEVISFSTYLGDTRWRDDTPSNRVLTTAVKHNLSIGSTHGKSENVNTLCNLYDTLGVNVNVMRSPIEAESRNISLYVHPPLFMNDFSLRHIFEEQETKTYVYKMFPEGPITYALIRHMLAHWKEIMGVLEALNIDGINLLKFMTEDNYPVRPESLPREDIENFNQLASIHQEYLVYIRYTSLLIDPFSEPDKGGRYFDFSAVPIRPVFVNREGYLDIPRMPKEDYYRLKIIQGIAHHLQVKSDTIDYFIQKYEEAIRNAAQSHDGKPLSDAFRVQTFHDDVAMIVRNLKSVTS
ncbi:opine metallophore biosynthesis dehydrogenase [Salipaludibacillus agaradhaerens]|uniref:Opine metallophore biosynthesis dehydrogenase n=1 Tax=Salipaludibacillus agaradhaerens TaxID=76935 RepID=A0A9Q4B4U0_SALAG|nr:opine metallophore biosynthesis dehydrogenase [Salipaludibacillus agaradhaerens]MCR6098165.1 opine metallophore biosynthesis dehydrogenase [Salipaludibacillus agaradhaerens]MCR6116205.1 opine metallophore biosynthesis dehydrogenase [Salipaludibacillus agaradhaerens]